MTDAEFRIFKVACKYYIKFKTYACDVHELDFPEMDELVDDMANECWISITPEQETRAIDFIKRY
jgi:hypothetical protein